MRMIKIVVTDNDQAMKIGAVLGEAEENGELDFGFTMRITEEMKPEDVKENLYREVLS